MRILVIGINYAPETTGIGPFTTGLAEHWQKSGHEVTVSTTFPHYPQWKWQVKPRLRSSDSLNGITVRRRRIILPRRPGASWRVAYDTSFGAVTLLNVSTVSRPDLVLCVSPPVQSAIAAGWLAFQWGVPLILLIQDLPLEAALSVGMLKPGRSLRWGRRMERYAYRMATRIVVIEEGFLGSLLQQGIDASKVVVIPDWADVDGIRPLERDADARARLGASDRDFLVLHSGNMGHKQGLANAVEAAALASPHVRLGLVGDGAQRAALQSMVDERQLTNVRLLPLQPAAEFPSYLAAADVLLLNQRAEIVDSVAPSKLLPYMSAGKPVLAAVHSDSAAARLIERAQCGLVVAPEDPRELARAMDKLAGDQAGRRRMGAAGRHFVERHFARDLILGVWDGLAGQVSVASNPGPDPHINASPDGEELLALAKKSGSDGGYRAQ
jgi:colanic acid biosynthesis glycosyl transferase WcaI